MTRELSEGYASGVRVINEVQEVDLKIWKDGYEWAKTAKCVNDAENEAGDIFYVATSKAESIDFTLTTIHGLNNRRFKSFDEYVIQRHNVFYTVNLNENSWLNSTCDCYTFFKKYVCKHVAGLAMCKNYCKMPKKALTVKLQKKTQKGQKTQGNCSTVQEIILLVPFEFYFH